MSKKIMQKLNHQNNNRQFISYLKKQEFLVQGLINEIFQKSQIVFICLNDKIKYFILWLWLEYFIKYL